MVPFQSRRGMHRDRYGRFPYQSTGSWIALTKYIGAKCGSTTIDRHLHALMERRYGSAFKEIADSVGIGSRFMTRFESIKRSFDGSEGDVFSLPLLMDHPDTDDYKQGLQKVTITRFDQHLYPRSQGRAVGLTF